MNPYIQSLRLRTLPLSVSGIIVGSGLAGWLRWDVFVLAVFTTLCLQILSNLSNELGDALKGTDADQHGRAAYGLQAGTITMPQMKRMILLFISLSVLFGIALIRTAFGSLCCDQSWVFIGLGALAIVGAMTYTLGRHSYGYMGLGDLGVFLFFGLLSTLGAYYLQTQTLTSEVAWLGVAVGLPCVGVLNLNNVRDMPNDRLHGKRTFAGLLGLSYLSVGIGNSAFLAFWPLVGALCVARLVVASVVCLDARRECVGLSDAGADALNRPARLSGLDIVVLSPLCIGVATP